MPWWGWILVAVMLLAAEALADLEFYLAFLGLAALMVGLAGMFGLESAIWQQWLAFGVLSVVFLMQFRGRVYGRIAPAPGTDPELIGEFAVANETIAPGAVGRVELRGTTWTAVNDDDDAIAEGDRVRVESVSGLTVHLRRNTPAQ